MHATNDGPPTWPVPWKPVCKRRWASSCTTTRESWAVSTYDALSTRKVIGQAIGVIRERYGVGEDRAFQYLVRAASTSNTKLRDVALELVGQTLKSTGLETGARLVNWTSVTSTSTGAQVAHD